ncbi:MAG: PAS domain S-box protein, partial [Candidatus Eisenbacteria bacterium]|nr:PAS domain S-box protein [Candidatus Eisenbacteria bacterium]
MDDGRIDSSGHEAAGDGRASDPGKRAPCGREPTAFCSRALERSGVAIAVIDGTDLVHASGALASLTGYTYDELAAMNAGELAERVLLADDTASVLDYHSRLVRGEDVPLHIEYRIRRKDGSVRWLEETAELVSDDGEPTVRAFLIDVTERKTMESRADRERRQLLSIFEGLDEYVYVADPDTHEILFINQSLKEVFGDITGRKCYEALQGREGPCPFCTNDRIFGENAGTSYVWEFRNENDRHWYRCIDKAIEWPDGRLVRAEIALDIDDLKTAEERLRAGEARYRSIFEGAAVSLCELDFSGFTEWVLRLGDRGVGDVGAYCVEHPDAVMRACGTMRILDANRESLRLFAVPSREELPESVAGFACPESMDFICGLARAVADGRNCYRAGTIIQTLDGEKLNVIMTVTLEPKSSSAFISVTDVTELKRIEQALRESEEHYREVVENAHEAIIVIQDGVIAFVNPRGAASLDLTPDDLVGRPFTDFIHPEERELLKERYQHRLAGEDVLQDYTYRSVTEDGRVVWGEVHATRITWDGRPATLNFVADVTERKLAEEARVAALAERAGIMEAMADGIVVVSREGRVLDVNPAMLELLGAAEKEVVGHDVEELTERFIAPEDVENALAGFAETARGDTPAPYVLHVVSATGETIPVSFKVSQLKTEEHDHPRILVDFHDMREILSVEHALRKSEAERRLFMEAATDAFTLWDADLNLVDANAEACRRLGLARDQLVGLNMREVYPPSTEPGVLDRYVEVIRTGDPYCAFDVSPAGELAGKRYSVKAFPVGDGLGLITTDTTERWKAQEALRRSEEHYRQVVENADEAITVAQDGRLKFFNRRLVDILGYDESEIRGMSFVEFIHPDDREMVAERHARRLNGENPQSQYGFRVVTKQGDLRHVRINAVRFEWGGRPATLNFILDTTEQVENERAIRERTQRLRLLFDRANDAILVMNGEVFIDCNERALEMFGCSREEIVGRPPYHFSPDTQPDGRDSRDKALEKLSAVSEGEPQSFEWTHCRADGTPFDAEVGLTSFTLDGKQYIQAFVKDITKRKRAEENVRSIARFPAENPNPVIRVQRDGRILYANEATDWLLDQWGCEVGHYLPPRLRETVMGAYKRERTGRLEANVSDRTYSFVLAP